VERFLLWRAALGCWDRSSPDSENHVSLRRRLIPLALLVGSTAAALRCADPSPVEVSVPMDAKQTAGGGTAGAAAKSNLLQCPQAYDSVTRVIGPAGGLIVVGAHVLLVDTMALSKSVRITAVAPSGKARWVRFRPNGLAFRTNGAGVSAILATSYRDCGVPTGTTPRLAQVSDLQSVLAYLDPSIPSAWKAWSQANQYVGGVLSHFSNYAVAW
jgi:hypothetical protein